MSATDFITLYEPNFQVLRTHAIGYWTCAELCDILTSFLHRPIGLTWDVVVHWEIRRLSSEGSWVRIPHLPPCRDLVQVLHSQLPGALPRETLTQYTCCVGSASE